MAFDVLVREKRRDSEHDRAVAEVVARAECGFVGRFDVSVTAGTVGDHVDSFARDAERVGDLRGRRLRVRDHPIGAAGGRHDEDPPQEARQARNGAGMLEPRDVGDAHHAGGAQPERRRQRDAVKHLAGAAIGNRAEDRRFGRCSRPAAAEQRVSDELDVR
jgi:hypothetical protein